MKFRYVKVKDDCFDVFIGQDRVATVCKWGKKWRASNTQGNRRRFGDTRSEAVNILLDGCRVR